MSISNLIHLQLTFPPKRHASSGGIIYKLMFVNRYELEKLPYLSLLYKLISTFKACKSLGRGRGKLERWDKCKTFPAVEKWVCISVLENIRQMTWNVSWNTVSTYPLEFIWGTSSLTIQLVPKSDGSEPRGLDLYSNLSNPFFACDCSNQNWQAL